jgi:type 1 glutamine amidotransferase
MRKVRLPALPKVVSARSVCLWALASLLLSLPVPAVETWVRNNEELARIEKALPAQAPAKARQPRKLLIFTLNVGYGGHPSMAYANEAFRRMGQKTGAFETVVSEDPAVFERSSLRQFDAVFFNNTVGNCFTNAELRRNLLEFILGGGGLLGVHGTSVAFTRWPGAIEDWPEFGYLIGARGANHKDSDEHVWMKRDDPEHPVTRVFGNQGFDFRDEFFRPQGTYSRTRVRVLLSMDHSRMDPNAGQPRGDCFRADHDYAVAWVRSYGRGRVFYSTIAHNPYVFRDARMLEFYLAAIQFALGDLEAPTTPSAWLSPGVLAQEKLGWRLGLQAGATPNGTFAEAIDQAAGAALPFISGSSDQPVGRELPKRFDPSLTDDELPQVRLRLEAAGVRLVTFDLAQSPEGEAGWRRAFEFGRKLGVETLLASPARSDLDLLEKLAREYNVHVALKSVRPASGGSDSGVRSLLQACERRDRHVGVCANLNTWVTEGVKPAQAVRSLKDRIFVVQLGAPGSHQRQSTSAAGQQKLLLEMHRLGVKPRLFAIEAAESSPTAAAELRKSVAIFDQSCLDLIGSAPLKP